MQNKIRYTVDYSTHIYFRIKNLKLLRKLLLSYFILSFAIPSNANSSISPKNLIILSNDQDFSRKEIINIPRKRFKHVDKSFFPIVYRKSDMLKSQVIDQDHDGIWDTLILEVTLTSFSSDTLTIKWVSKNDFPQFKAYTSVRLSLKSKNNLPTDPILTKERDRGFIQNISDPIYQMEGPGIENDKVAFRAFFDNRNGKDVYGKLTEEPILSKVGLSGSWHKLQDWGMDILRTGNSLGAGAFAIKEDTTIYKLADADRSIYNFLYDGALQSAFSLTFQNWDVGLKKKNGTETISLAKGDFFYKNELRLHLDAKQQLISGMAHFGSDSIVFKKHNNSFSSISCFGNQADGTNSKLGLAIMFTSADFVENKVVAAESTIPNTAYVVLKPQKKTTVFFFACWEKTDRQFENLIGFENYLQKIADQLANPIKINIIN